MITRPKLPPQSLIFSSLSFFAATPLAPHASDLDLLLAVNKQIKVLNVKAVTFLLQMVSLPVLLIIILASSVMEDLVPSPQIVSSIATVNIECAKAVVMSGMTVLAARPATKYASRAAQNMELSKHARINLNELGIEQEMKKQSSQLQQ